jgi:EmrB/QacA subfamily drug resistance transporter
MTSWPNRRKRLALLCVGTGTLLSSLNSSLTNTLLPTIERSLHISIGQSKWIVLIYLLVLTASLIPIGRLSDLLGHRKIFLCGFAVFSCASVLCGLSRNFLSLFIGRGFLAFGGAMILSVGPAILTAAFPPEQRGRVLGLQALMTYVGLAIGPVIGGGMAQWLGWQSAFFITLPFSVCGLLIGLWAVPGDAAEEKKPADAKGSALFIAAMASVTLLLNSDSIEIPHSLLLPLLAALFAGSAWRFVRAERRSVSPMIDLKLFRVRNFGFGSLSASLNYLCFFLATFIIPFYFDQILHGTSFETGVYMTIPPIVMTAVAPIAGALSDRAGTRVFSMLGMLLDTISLVVLGVMALAAPFSRALLILGLVLAGLGNGIFAAPNNSAIMGAAPLSRQGMASGVLATFRYMGMIAGTTLGGSLFNVIASRYARAGMDASAAFIGAFSAVLWIGVLFAAAGFALTFFMEKKPRGHEPSY